MPREIPLAHPGEILLEDFLKPLGISQYALAKAINVPPVGSTKSSTGCAASRPIRPCAWRHSSARTRKAGSTCKATTTPKPPARPYGTPWRASAASSLPMSEPTIWLSSGA